MIRIESNFDRIIIRPKGYLGQEQFSKYLSAAKTGGAWYDKSLRAQVSRGESLADIILALKKAGFQVELESALEAHLQHVVAATKSELSHIERRLEGLPVRPFQRAGIEWLSQMPGAILADDMGLGKTMQALLAANGRLLVVCPAGLKAVWAAEAARWRPDLRPVILRGNGSFRWPAEGELVILNYEILPDTAPPCPGPINLIADEAHYLKNAKALRTQRFRALASAVRAQGGKVWELTGTPLLGHEPELWAILVNADLQRTTFGTWVRYRELMGGYIGRYGTEWSGRIHPSVPGILERVMLRRRKTDVLAELPPKTRQMVPVEIRGEAARLCDEAVRIIEDRTGMSLDELFQRLLDDEGSAPRIPFEKLSEARHALAKAKIEALVELVEAHEDAGEPVIVFSAHLAPIHELAKRDGWAAITGAQTAEERSRIVEAFQAGKLRGVACTIQAGGLGLTLTRASNEIFVDLSWTPAENLQAEDRAWRIGQKNALLVRWLVANHPLEQRMAELLQAKMQLIEATVEATATRQLAQISTRGERLSQALEAAQKAVDETSAVTTGAAEAGQRNGTASKRKVRGPKNAAERWAAEGLLILARRDPDRGRVRNDLGFNLQDNKFGHSLAESLQEYGGLTDAQWAAAIRMLRKYHRQIGACPT
jgi:SNF2 family DNA or RNA helicase